MAGASDGAVFTPAAGRRIAAAVRWVEAQRARTPAQGSGARRPVALTLRVFPARITAVYGLVNATYDAVAIGNPKIVVEGAAPVDRLVPIDKIEYTPLSVDDETHASLHVASDGSVSLHANETADMDDCDTAVSSAEEFSADDRLITTDGTSGRVAKQSPVTVTDAGNMSGVGTLSAGSVYANTRVYTDLIDEAVEAEGVTIDGVLVKDGEVDGRDVSADGADLDKVLAAQILTLAASAALTNERILTAGDAIEFADAGAGSTLTVSGVTAHNFQAYLATSAQSIPSSAWTTIVYNTEDFDTESAYNTANGRLTLPAGRWLFGGINIIEYLGDGKYIINALFKNGSLFGPLGRGSASASMFVGPAGVIMDDANGTDYYEYRAFHNQGSNLNASVYALRYCHAWALRVA